MTHAILLVDDQATNLLMLEQMLAGLGYRFLHAASGAQALEIVRREPVAAILLDLQMPDMDGIEVIRRLRSEMPAALPPIMLITASSPGDPAIQSAYEAGAIDFLQKPLNQTILRRKVELLCTLVEKECRIQEQLAEAEQRNRQLEELVKRHQGLEESHLESEVRYRSLIALCPIPVVVQVAGAVVYYNGAARQMFGFKHDGDGAGEPFHTFMIESDQLPVREAIGAITRRGGRSDPVPCRLANGRHVELHIGCILYDDEIGVQMAVQDVSAHKDLEYELLRLSQVDGLTGVSNRRFFDDAIAREWRRHTRSGHPLSVLMIDLDQFKHFNDLYGHQAGDDCLRRVAATLRATANRADDVVARYGGEEFVVVLPGTSFEGANGLAGAMVASVSALGIPHEGNEPVKRVTLSCGVATAYPRAGRANFESLVKLADGALYKAKRDGGNRWYRDPADTVLD